MIAEILNSYDLHLTFLRRLVSDLDKFQMVCQPKNVPNHPAWTIGHLVHSWQLIGGEIGIPPWLPADWRDRFGTGSTPVADPKAYPAKDALLRALVDGKERLTAALRAMKELDLNQPLPDVRYRDRFPTLGHAVIHILSGHTALHVGQLVVWRRVMAFDVVPEPLNEKAAMSGTTASDESGGALAEGDAHHDTQRMKIRNSIDSAPTKEEVDFLDAQLEQFNNSKTGRDDFSPLHLVLRDDDGSVIAGLKAITGWNWLYIQVLWVHEEHRRNGLGSMLLRSAEVEARRRGCVGACLSSCSFQAPAFYERHGYGAFGQIDEYPAGHTMYFLSKQLEDAVS